MEEQAGKHQRAIAPAEQSDHHRDGDGGGEHRHVPGADAVDSEQIAGDRLRHRPVDAARNDAVAGLRGRFQQPAVGGGAVVAGDRFLVFQDESPGVGAAGLAGHRSSAPHQVLRVRLGEAGERVGGDEDGAGDADRRRSLIAVEAGEGAGAADVVPGLGGQRLVIAGHDPDIPGAGTRREGGEMGRDGGSGDAAFGRFRTIEAYQKQRSHG